MTFLNNFKIGKLTELKTHNTLGGKDIFNEVIRKIAIFQNRQLENKRVLIKASSQIDFFTDILALFEIGATAIPYSPELTSFEIDNLKKHSQAACVLEGAGIYTIINTNKTCTNEDNIALILYTSGTTGVPKAIPITFDVLRRKIEDLGKIIPFQERIRTLCLLPMSFGHGLICNSLFPLLSNNHLFIAPPFDLETLYNLNQVITENDITFMSSVPSLWNIYFSLQQDTQTNVSLQRIHCASAQLSEKLWNQIKTWGSNADVYNVYGITETAGWIGMTDKVQNPITGNVGKLISGSYLILDENQAPLSPGELGEIAILTPYNTTGYLDNSLETSRRFINGYFKTGDMGKIDVSGNLILIGRMDFTINRGSLKIFPDEIDSLIQGHPSVFESCSVGVPDNLWGEKMVSFIVLKKNEVDLREEVKSWVRTRLSNKKCPSHWIFIEKIPKNNRGKSDVKKLKAMFTHSQTEE